MHFKQKENSGETNLRIHERVSPVPNCTRPNVIRQKTTFDIMFCDRTNILHYITVEKKTFHLTLWYGYPYFEIQATKATLYNLTQRHDLTSWIYTIQWKEHISCTM